MYPYYLTQTSNNKYCLFTFFIGGKRASIDCLNASNGLSNISSAILNNPYFQNITQVSINNRSSFSELPSLLCVLPSRSIDLSNQSFTIFDSRTFPCESFSTFQTINLAFNRIRDVSLVWTSWSTIDLTSNLLAQFPYSIFQNNLKQNIIRETLVRTQRTLLLTSNTIDRFDLSIYTYATTHVDLRMNPFQISTNGYHIVDNYLNRSLPVMNISTTVAFPNSMRFLIDDRVAQEYGSCDSRSLNTFVTIFERIKLNDTIVDIECQCSSFYVKEYFKLLNRSARITDRFSCSRLSALAAEQFESLSEADCQSNIVLSSRRLCEFARFQVIYSTSSRRNRSISFF
jgi:hypothetical protein